MPKGGRREGSGRKPGSPNKLTVAHKLTVAEIAGQYTDRAFKVLAEIMDDEDAPAAARVICANSLIDRKYGKARQPVDYEIDLSKLTDEQVEAIYAVLAARSAVAALAEGAGGDREAPTSH